MTFSKRITTTQYKEKSTISWPKRNSEEPLKCLQRHKPRVQTLANISTTERFKLSRKQNLAKTVTVGTKISSVSTYEKRFSDQYAYVTVDTVCSVSSCSFLCDIQFVLYITFIFTDPNPPGVRQFPTRWKGTLQTGIPIPPEPQRKRLERCQ